VAAPLLAIWSGTAGESDRLAPSLIFEVRMAVAVHALLGHPYDQVCVYFKVTDARQRCSHVAMLLLPAARMGISFGLLLLLLLLASAASACKLRRKQSAVSGC